MLKNLISLSKNCIFLKSCNLILKKQFKTHYISNCQKNGDVLKLVMISFIIPCWKVYSNTKCVVFIIIKLCDVAIFCVRIADLLATALCTSLFMWLKYWALFHCKCSQVIYLEGIKRPFTYFKKGKSNKKGAT